MIDKDINESNLQLDKELLHKKKPVIQRPSMYKVILLNDDVTPMDFVVMILKKFFNKSDEESVAIMLEAHNSGNGKCGVYTKDVAETKITQVINMARDSNFPLKVVLNKEHHSE